MLLDSPYARFVPTGNPRKTRVLQMFAAQDLLKGADGVAHILRGGTGAGRGEIVTKNLYAKAQFLLYPYPPSAYFKLRLSPG